VKINNLNFFVKIKKVALVSVLGCLIIACSNLPKTISEAPIPVPDTKPDPNLPHKDSADYRKAQDAVRLLAQASFGATPKSIQRIITLGPKDWIDEQMSLPQTFHLNLLDKRFADIGMVVAPVVDDSKEGYSRDLQRSDIWWEVAIWGEDQLRQRIAYSLSQILVISNMSDVLYNDTRGIANYHDLLAKHAFGNYRDLLKAVTLNPMMGEYLSMVRNEKADVTRNIRPDENYARELMQLFSIGLVELNLDGTVKLDLQGNPIPTYDQSTIKELARIFTGWNLAGINQWHQFTESGSSEILPMQAFADYHDFGSKVLFGTQKIAANNSPEQDIDAALDIIFAHPNVAPFISKQLIQRLVTSNPSPAYVERVAHVFNNNKKGVKGDLRAVITAILMDKEARADYHALDNFGKYREPVLKLAQLLRAFKATGIPIKFNNENQAKRLRLYSSDKAFGQRAYAARSVFNFYRPDYQQPGKIRNTNLNSPEFQILNESMIMAQTSELSRSIFWRDTPHEWLEPTFEEIDIFPSRLHIDNERSVAANPAELLDRLNLLLMAGQMSSRMYDLLLTHLKTYPVDPTWGAEGQMWARDTLIYEAIFFIVASPEYAFQR
jgi:uncharacterized protein (DUF1800 family)